MQVAIGKEVVGRGKIQKIGTAPSWIEVKEGREKLKV